MQHTVYSWRGPKIAESLDLVKQQKLILLNGFSWSYPLSLYPSLSWLNFILFYVIHCFHIFIVLCLKVRQLHTSVAIAHFQKFQNHAKVTRLRYELKLNKHYFHGWRGRKGKQIDGFSSILNKWCKFHPMLKCKLYQTQSLKQ